MGVFVRKIWSMEKIVQQVARLKRQGVDLSAGQVSRSHPALFSAASSAMYFGSWRLALEAAKLNYDSLLRKTQSRRVARIQKWPRSKLILVLRGISSQQRKSVYKKRPELYAAARRQFGTWRAAVKAAGPFRRPRKVQRLPARRRRT